MSKQAKEKVFPIVMASVVAAASIGGTNVMLGLAAGVGLSTLAVIMFSKKNDSENA